MSLATFNDLVSTVTEYLAREQDTTLIARIPDFVRLAEAKFNRNLFCMQMEKRAYTTAEVASTSPEFVTLPADFQSMRSIRLSAVNGKPRLSFMNPTQMDEYRQSIGNVVGQPMYVCPVGTEIELAPTPNADTELEMIYRATIPLLNSNNQTNWLLTFAPDAYLYGCLMEAAPYLRNDDRISVWGAGLKIVVDSLNDLAQKQSFGAGPMSIRTSGFTP
jgi:hypothetical protein